MHTYLFPYTFFIRELLQILQCDAYLHTDSMPVQTSACICRHTVTDSCIRIHTCKHAPGIKIHYRTGSKKCLHMNGHSLTYACV